MQRAALSSSAERRPISMMIGGAVQQYHGRALFQVRRAITFGDRPFSRSHGSEMMLTDGKLQEKGNGADIYVVYSNIHRHSVDRSGLR